MDVFLVWDTESDQKPVGVFSSEEKATAFLFERRALVLRETTVLRDAGDKEFGIGRSIFAQRLPLDCYDNNTLKEFLKEKENGAAA